MELKDEIKNQIPSFIIALSILAFQHDRVILPKFGNISAEELNVIFLLTQSIYRFTYDRRR